MYLQERSLSACFKEGDQSPSASPAAVLTSLSSSTEPPTAFRTHAGCLHPQLDSNTITPIDAPTETVPAAAYCAMWNGPGDPECPLNLQVWRKWLITIILSQCSLCVTCCSSIAASTYAQMTVSLVVSELVCTLSVSFFVAGLGLGPLIFAPISEAFGRAIVLRVAFLTFFCCNVVVAFAPQISLFLMFRFLAGIGGSASLSVAGSVISDMFSNQQVATPMMFWSAAPFVGPVLGPLIGGFINQNACWRWTYYFILIWAATILALLYALVKETHAPILLQRRARRLRDQSGDERYRVSTDTADNESDLMAGLKASIKLPFLLLATEPMVLALNIWSAMILGILYLSFSGLPYVFKTQYGFDLQQCGMAFLGIALGQTIAIASQPWFNMKYRQAACRNGGRAPPEARLVSGKVGAICCPMGLLLLGATCSQSVPWVIPILSMTFFGAGMVFSYTAIFTYLVDAYRPVAASALASNSFCRSSFAAAFPLFGMRLYRDLGPVGATCLLGGIMAIFAPLPFVFSQWGPRARARSKLTALLST